MSREMLTLLQAAGHVHLDVNELRHFAQRGEVAALQRGGNWYFEHRALDEWAQRNLLASDARALKDHYRAMTRDHRPPEREGWNVSSLVDPQAVDLDVRAKAKAGLLRDMTDLAVRSGKVYDDEALFKELVAREESASTAIGNGLALLHPRFHDPYLFESSFIAYGRSVRPVFFGAADGEGTRHFFLICSTDHETHLHLLARLAVLAHGTDLVSSLDAAVDVTGVMEAVCAAERGFAS